MQLVKPVGRAAAARKYDVLTALGAFALAEDKTVQRRVLRLITLITARYNWSRDLLAVGQREMAQMWSVDERTVKREMARMRAQGWLVLRRAGARGRVAEYSIDFDAILADTELRWRNVGPDFDLRMRSQNMTQDPAQADIVPLPVKGQVPPPNVTAGTEWALTQALLHQEDPALYAAWIKGLERADRLGGRLVLKAPSQFHASYILTHLQGRIQSACASVDDSVTDIRIVV